MGTKSKASATPPVRLLHTSDWHIGRRLDLVDLLDQQAAFGEWLVEVVRTEGLDGVLIAGEVHPPSHIFRSSERKQRRR